MGQANDPFGQILGERLAVTIDGQQVKLFDWDKEMRGAPRSGVPTPADSREGGPAQGRRHVPRDQLRARQQHQRRLSRARRSRPAAFPGIMFFPHVGKVRIEGPFNASRALRHAEPPQDFRLPAGERREPPSGRGVCADDCVDAGAPGLSAGR